ncbi:hypothetical protein WJX72_002350 [[Myrmecia] bisecta]|uniref:Uncharacterized protein n=1 Tax=[Myrmecia] bisecta TaxID=41462 RepID=A0AAW1R4C4_9CHLO
MLKRVYSACEVLGDSFVQRFTSNDLQQATTIVTSMGTLSDKPLASDFLSDFCAKIEAAGVPAFKGVKLSLCYDALDLLHSGEQFRGCLEQGGKLLAAAIIAAVYAIASKEAAPLPFLGWLSELSGYPKAVIHAQAESVICFVLS